MFFRKLALCALIVLQLVCSQAKEPPLVILVGIDGFRWDYLEKFQPQNLSRLAAGGARAERMLPSFPSLTFPNFYTLATGLYPEHHGIIGNSMFDPDSKEKFSLGSPAVKDGKWWGGEPIWNTAEKQGLRTACMFWPGSEAEIGGMRPTEWRPFDYKVSPEMRVQTVLDWLALPPEKRPRLITLYFHEADTAGHKFGPDSPETAEAVRVVDEAIGRLVEGIRKLGLEDCVNLLIVADHGMAEVSPDRVIALSEMLDMNTVHVDFSGAVAGLRPLEGTADALFQKLKASQRHFQVYRREDMPERFHFRNHRRIPPVIMVADEGWTIIRTPLHGKMRDSFLRGTHGFDPALPSMGATFIACGPAFPKGVTLAPFENVHVYNLACSLLGLQPAPNDGDNRLADQLLKK